MKKFFFLLFTQLLLYSQNSKNTDISVYDESILNIIDLNSKIELLDSSFLVAEGPLWYPKKNQLIFSDVRQNKIFTWDENSGTVEYISPSGSTGVGPICVAKHLVPFLPRIDRHQLPSSLQV